MSRPDTAVNRKNKEQTYSAKDRYKTIDCIFPEIDRSFQAILKRYMNKQHHLERTRYKAAMESFNKPENMLKKLNIDEFYHKVENLIDGPVWNPTSKFIPISITVY